MTQTAGFDLLDDQGALLGNDRFIGPGYTAITPIPGSEDELVLSFTSTTGATTGIRGLGLCRIRFTGGWPKIYGTPFVDTSGLSNR